MVERFIGRALIRGVWSVLFISASPALLAQDETVEGVFALPDTDQAVTGHLAVTETGPLTRQIELTYASLASGEQINNFDVELTQQLHILATDAKLTHLIHEHADVVGADGSFIAELEFPEAGLYHIYTDAVPTDLGQQVLRFDVMVGEATEGVDEPAPVGRALSDGALVSSDGPYSVTLDGAQLRPGAESAVSLLVEKDGVPADDLEPYLGVSAHAVFISAEDLAYVHAHAMGAGDTEAHGTHGAGPAAPADEASGAHQHGAAPTPETAHTDHGTPSHADGHGGHHGPPATRIDPEMSLVVTPPAAGTYALWVEFIGGDEIRTVPFTIEIPESGSHASH